MEHINIIVQEEITTPIVWPSVIILVISMAAMIGVLIYICVAHDTDKGLSLTAFVVLGSVVAMFIEGYITSTFFRVPTGRYKYEATVDKDKITVSEYEKFIEEYNPTIKDGIYYWEDKAE